MNLRQGPCWRKLQLTLNWSRVQLASVGEGRCSSAMSASVDSVELAAVVCAADEPGTHIALEHITSVDPASQGVPLQQVQHFLAC